MSRARVAILALVAALLVVDGPPAGGTAAAVGAEAPAEASVEAPARIHAYLERHNPLLTQHEIDRIVESVVRCSDNYGLDPYLVASVLHTESTARPWVISPKGAVGLMQVMPYMFELFDLAGNITTIESNIEAGCLILASNIRRLGEEDGISSYFWGSQIRGLGYLERVRAARSSVRRWLDS